MGFRPSHCERRTFEAFVDFVMDRRKRFPNLHIYHFSHYEPKLALKLSLWDATQHAKMKWTVYCALEHSWTCMALPSRRFAPASKGIH